MPHELRLLPALGCLLPLHEHVVVDLPDAVVERLSRPKEERIECVALVPREVLLGGPIVRGEGIHVGTPFEVMPQLVGEGFPGLRTPVEVAEPGEARERAVIENDPRVQIGPAAAPLEGHALAERVDITVHGMREGVGADVDGNDPVAELGWHLARQAVDHDTEIIEAHWGTLHQPFSFCAR